MAERLTGELIVVQGFVASEVDGKALRMKDPDLDAEPDDTVVAPVVSEPVALAGQLAMPLLRALSAHAHVQVRPIATKPIESSGYFAIAQLSTNDPDLEPYGGRKITLPTGLSKVIQLPYNAPLTTVTADMAAQTGLTAGSQVRAVWFADAAEYEAPEPGPDAYYTAEQVDSIVAGLGSPSWGSITDKPTFASVATSGAYGDLSGRPDLSSYALTSTVAELARDAVGAALVGGQHTGISFVADDDGDHINATVTVSGGSGGGGTTLTQTATKAGNYTAAAGEAVPLSTAGGTFTLTFPSGAPLGAQVAARWVSGTAAPTISAPSGETIGSAQTTTLTLAPGSTSGEFVAWQKWTSTTWLPVGGFKPQAALDARYDARYQPVETATSTAFRATQTTAQSIANSADTVVSMPVVARASSLVTVGTQGAGSLFTVSRAGVWAITATARLTGAPAAGSLYASLIGGGAILTAADAPLSGGAKTRTLSVTDYFDAGTAFYLALFQSSGAAVNTEPGNGIWVNLRLAWLHA